MILVQMMTFIAFNEIMMINDDFKGNDFKL